MSSKQSADPSVTFIIPAFKEEKLVSYAIRSIHAETAGRPNEYEILVVDNAHRPNC
jgi:glycosyltransferase involved in cell wall biosynthesis